MKLLASLALSSSYLFLSVEAAASKYAVYKANIAPIPGVDTQVSGSVVVFADTADGTTVGYGGHVMGLEANLNATDCLATNGCGVHIHSGMGCENSTAQGGHYFSDPVSVDPWISAQYSSGAEGSTEFGAFLEMGTIDLEGRAFVVHAEDGSRVGCGILEMVNPEDTLTADLVSLGDSSATGAVTALPVDNSDMICYMGHGSGLEPNLSAFYSSSEGPNCASTNGCGTHVHAGTSCESSETQMGHYYTGESDPWAIVGYESTSDDGAATYMACLSTGETEYDGKAFILHADNGSRVACGLLEKQQTMPTYEVYQTTIVPIPGVDTQVSGTVAVFANTADGTTVGYGGHVTGLQANLDATNCPATNGCGVHIHSGMGCEDSAAQGGHYFSDPVMVDPWISAQYSSDASGMTTFASSVEMGTVDLEGRAFVVHAEDGSRVGCGVLTKVKDPLTADLAPLGSSTAMGSVSAVQLGESDTICYMGYAMNLEPDLSAFFSSPAGPDCTATNGCGTHVHAGTSCESSETQMGHYYEGETDPWAIVGYESTSANGAANYIDCISTGLNEYDGKAFIVHSNDGGRVACGLLEKEPIIPTYEVYHTTIVPIPGVDTQVSGTVAVFANTADGTTVGYGGHVTGLQADLDATNCPATNGCGVHIHSGMGCEDSAAQGGHYFSAPVMVDPWIPAQYSSDANGATTFASSVEMGTVDLEGRAFVVHAEDGSRVGCGILTKVESPLKADLAPLGSSTAMGSVSAVQLGESDTICYMGHAMNLEPDLSAFYSSPAGPDCTATNGCGTHVHAGTSCESSETQMGHYYEGETDPWAIVGYESTGSGGFANYIDCISTGLNEYDGKAFIVHSNGGGRVACGLLTPEDVLDSDPVEEEPPVPTFEVYHATIVPIPGVDTQVSGTVAVFANTVGGTTVGYGGHVTGLQANLDASNCPATNGCGVHIHSGMGCEDSAAQGGHYFSEPVMVDPWISAQYSSDANGATTFASSVEMGTVDLEGRAFVVHAEDGSRVGCGILTKVRNPLTADLAPLGESSAAMGSVSAVQLGETDTICYMGYAMNLEPSLSAFYSRPIEGPDCTATNGCGTHVHAGTSCESSETQMGHYYEGETDPWAIIGYESTTPGGFANYIDCISTGLNEYDGKAFIVHSNSGGRVACGLLSNGLDDLEIPFTDAPGPTDSPVASPTDAPVNMASDDSDDEGSAGNAASMAVALATSLAVGLWTTVLL